MSDLKNKSNKDISNDNLSQLIKKLDEKLNELQNSTKSAKWTNRIMIVLIVVCVIIGISMLFTPFFCAYKNPEPYKTAMANSIQTMIFPQLQKEACIMLDSVSPALKTSVTQRVVTNLPDISKKVENEWGLMVENMSGKLDVRMATKGEEISERLKKVLTEEFPDLADPEKSDIIMSNAYKASASVVDKILQKYFADHTEAVIKIHERIDDFHVPEHIKRMENKDLIDYLFDTSALYISQTVKTSMSTNMKSFLQEHEESKK